MAKLAGVGTKVVRGMVLRDDPAREACFRIVHLHEDIPDIGGMGDEHRRQRLHRDYNQEVQTVELAALCLAEYPDAPWDLRMEFARQCWDESRHAALLLRRLIVNGGHKGQYPIANLDWSVVGMLDSLVSHLAIQHRTFEAGSLDIDGVGIPLFRAAGDPDTAEVMEAIEADEIHHVRFGNDWLRRLTDEEPRAVLQIASAVSWLKRVVKATGGEALHQIPTERGARALAGFSAAEIDEVVRLEDRLNRPATARPMYARDAQ